MRTGVLALVLLVACGDNLKPNTPGDAGPDAAEGLCGNGMLDPNEACDEGTANGGSDARCSTLCQWVCLDDAYCTDNEPCNGEETCSDHRCVAGTDLADGVTCGTGKLCRNAACTDSVCGDLFVTAPAEECDDANSTGADGCENNCKFSCVSTDVTRNCTPADACAGQGVCNDATHVCAAGTPLVNNTPCGTGGYCRNSVCTQPVCGNGMIELGEICDNGASNGTAGNGCKSDCTYACVVPATDCPTAPTCQMQTCNVNNACAAVPDVTKNGMTCGSGLICANGACVTPTAVCGNGTVETGEQCDFGTGNNGAGTGCELNCQFSCTISPNSCNDNNPCNGAETCSAVTVNARPGQRCSATAPLADNTACGTGMICKTQVCVNSICGDAYVDANRGETCEPPNTASCDALCRTIACGDSVRAGTEQCDDGNLTNLDGCDGTCKFEQCHRVNSLALAMPPPAAGGVNSTYCPANALGARIVGGVAQNQIGAALTNGVRDGSITIELKAIGLDDLTGTADPALSLGVLTGSPVAGAGYDGRNDLDWWYTTSASVINAMRVPTTQVPATIAAKVLNGGPSDIAITVNLAGMPATLSMLNAKLRTNLGTATTPLTSTGSTPGHLASENLNPTLTSFATATGGELCGNVTAQSLRNVLAPTALVGCGGLFAPCTQCYTATSTLLDIIVSGCTNALLGVQIAPLATPDRSRSGTDSYTFTVNASRVVTGCTKNGGMTATLAECLANAAYSSLLRFTTDRVIAK